VTIGWKSVSPGAMPSLPWYFGSASCITLVGSWFLVISDGL
jgi:hypothetical protein